MQSYTIQQYEPHFNNAVWLNNSDIKPDLEQESILQYIQSSDTQQCFLCGEKLPDLDSYELHLKSRHADRNYDASINRQCAASKIDRKLEKNRRARERMVLKRKNPEYRAKENERKRLKRLDPVYRKNEQDRNTMLHRRKRLDPIYRERERKRNSEQRRIKRLDMEYRIKEQARNTAQKRKKREDPMYRFIEQMNEKERRRKKKLKLDNKFVENDQEVIDDQPVKMEISDSQYFGVETVEHANVNDIQNWSIIADQLQEHIRMRFRFMDENK